MTNTLRLRLLVLLGALGLLLACTPREHAAWLQWQAQDPAAAQAFADEWVANHLAQPARLQNNSDSGGGTVWDRLAQCESGGNWAINTGNGYFGGLQFTLSSWRAAGGSGMPHQASREEQIRVAENLLDMQGWGAWPACSRKLGLR